MNKIRQVLCAQNSFYLLCEMNKLYEHHEANNCFTGPCKALLYSPMNHNRLIISGTRNVLDPIRSVQNVTVRSRFKEIFGQLRAASTATFTPELQSLESKISGSHCGDIPEDSHNHYFFKSGINGVIL